MNLDGLYRNWNRGALENFAHDYNMQHTAEWLAQDEEMKWEMKNLYIDTISFQHFNKFLSVGKTNQI